MSLQTRSWHFHQNPLGFVLGFLWVGIQFNCSVPEKKSMAMVFMDGNHQVLCKNMLFQYQQTLCLKFVFYNAGHSVFSCFVFFIKMSALVAGCYKVEQPEQCMRCVNCWLMTHGASTKMPTMKAESYSVETVLQLSAKDSDKCITLTEL